MTAQGSPAHAGTHPAERQLFQYTIDLTRDPTRRKIKNSKVKPQKNPCRAACREATQAQTGYPGYTKGTREPGRTGPMPACV